MFKNVIIAMLMFSTYLSIGNLYSEMQRGLEKDQSLQKLISENKKLSFQNANYRYLEKKRTKRAKVRLASRSLVQQRVASIN